MTDRDVRRLLIDLRMSFACPGSGADALRTVFFKALSTSFPSGLKGRAG